MPATSVFTIPGGNPQAPGPGEVTCAFDTTSKEWKVFDGTTLYTIGTTGTLGTSGAPLSGSAGTGAATFAQPGIRYVNTSTGVSYFNEGTLASPYWTPTSFQQPGLFGAYEDFRNGVSEALAATNTTATLVASGVRIHGQGLDETDSGVVVAISEAGAIASMTTTDEDAHVVALGFGSNAGGGPFQPDTHGPMVIDATVAMSSALTLRRFFIGFIGTAADALDPPVTGATTTITLVQDDLAGLFYDAALTAATSLFAPHNKSDEAASLTTTQAALDTPTVFPTAGTYARYRVEISAAGVMTCFINKTLVHTKAASLDVDEEAYPSLLIGSTSTAVKTMLCKQFMTWGSKA